MTKGKDFLAYFLLLPSHIAIPLPELLGVAGQEGGAASSEQSYHPRVVSCCRFNW